MRIGTSLYYMAKEWQRVPGSSNIDIFNFECFNMLLMVLTLGDMIRESESSSEVLQNPVMMALTDIWDDMQVDIDFEG
jgi:hypothetical protein